MNVTYGQKQILFAYSAMLVAVGGWLFYMDSSPRNPLTVALVLWLCASVVSLFFSYRALRYGSLLQRLLTLPLFVYYLASSGFYMGLLTSPTGRH